MGAGDQRRAPDARPDETYPVSMLQEAEWAPAPVWTDSKHLFSTGIRSPDRPSRSKSLYWLRYPGSQLPREYRKSREDGYFSLRLQLIIR